MGRGPGPGPDHQLVATDRALVGVDRGDGAGVDLVAGHLHAVDPSHPPLAALLVESPHRHVGARVARAVLVEDHVAVGGLEVGPDRLQEVVRLLAGVEVGRVAALVLRGGEPLVVLGLVLLADRDVADLLEAEVDRVALPHLDAGPQDGVERAGHVEVAHAAAGQPGGPGTRALLVDDDHLVTRPEAPPLQSHRQVVGGRQPVHPGADHDERGPLGQRVRVVDRDDGRVGAALGQRSVHERVPLVVARGAHVHVASPRWSMVSASEMFGHQMVLQRAPRVAGLRNTNPVGAARRRRSSRTPGSRSSTASRASRASRRARWAPRQEWGPVANARWGPAGSRAGSRLTPASDTRTRSPAAIPTPASVVSAVA